MGNDFFSTSLFFSQPLTLEAKKNIVSTKGLASPPLGSHFCNRFCRHDKWSWALCNKESWYSGRRNVFGPVRFMMFGLLDWGLTAQPHLHQSCSRRRPLSGLWAASERRSLTLKEKNVFHLVHLFLMIHANAKKSWHDFLAFGFLFIRSVQALAQKPVCLFLQICSKRERNLPVAVTSFLSIFSQKWDFGSTTYNFNEALWWHKRPIQKLLVLARCY